RLAPSIEVDTIPAIQRPGGDVMIEWKIEGPELATCNCDWGCPCQFNRPPTHGNCRAAVGMKIEKGHFGDVRLDGLAWVGLFVWPGAIHEGRGEAQPIIDERATPAQRDALLTILSGKESQPGANVFSVFASTLEKVHEPLLRPVTVESDMESRKGRIIVPGVVEAKAEPIRNPVTGQPHRARLQLPNGFEFRVAEFASSTTKAKGSTARGGPARHAHLARLNLTGHGPVG